MIFFVFFIPEALICFLGGLLVILAVIYKNISDTIFNFCTENFWIFITLTIIAAIIVVIRYAKERGVFTIVSYLAAISHLLFLFLDVLYGCFVGGAMIFIFCVPVLILYSFLWFLVISWADDKAIEGGNPLWLILVAICGWIVSFLLFG